MAGPTKLDIAIVEGGVCGLTLAIGLQKRGIKAHIYEATVRTSFALNAPCVILSDCAGQVRRDRGGDRAR